MSLLTFCIQAKSQFRYDRQGRPINELSYTDIEGDPYLATDWATGTVTLQNGKNVGATLKFDIYADRLLFQGKNSETLEFIDKLTGFTLNITNTEISNISPLVFANNFPAVDKQTENSWYQVIADGKVKLLKYYGKQTSESRAFNSATNVKTFVPFQFYYLFRNNQMIKTSLNKKSILKAFDDYGLQTEAYLKSNNINFKSDVDLQKLFAWYNSLN
ncbi:hypothetical protein KXD93_20365 [Mucilaginibacter sp. BJC16-A38]|uniref:hypothetical protein n=1 Tax=Mucilaginibacter phenanthrenivorans TaxID=1234842 RepID=UPI002157647E|nr:hypothetical protein [Mucilaginibacter phenanthrenivorans]MCR8560018.1 hypothetical protein [Mucilaginibacter phenanthrenivorans]